jgi:hypothetical protein
VQKVSSTKAQPPLGFFHYHPMAKKKSVLPKAPTEWEKLQTERETIVARLEGKQGYLGTFDRQAAAVRLVEVKRALNRLYAAKQ